MRQTKNDDGRRIVDYCTEGELCLGNMYFKHNNLHKYTREGRDQEEEKIRRRRNRLEYLQSVKVGKEMGRVLSDQ